MNKLKKQETGSSLKQYLARETTLPDLLKAVPAKAVIREYGLKPVLETIYEELDLCAYALGFESDKKRMLLIARDMIERYGYDSVEDMVAAIRKGRRGEYGFGFEKRVLSMVVLSGWMSRHLEEKVAEKERAHNNVKKGDTVVSEESEQPEWLRKAIRQFCEKLERKEVKKTDAVQEYRAWREAIQVMNYYYRRGVDLGEVPKFIDEFVAWRMKHPKHTNENIPKKFREALEFFNSKKQEK